MPKKRIAQIPLNKYRIQGKAAYQFMQQWDMVPLSSIASSIPNLKFKQGPNKLVVKCVFHEDSTESAVILPPGGGPANYMCSVCGSATLFEVFAHFRNAVNGGEASLFACEEFGISKSYAVIGVKNQAIKSTQTDDPNDPTGNGSSNGKKLPSGYIDPILTEEALDEMHHNLLGDEDAIEFICTEKAWSIDVIKEFKIGYFDRGKSDKRYIVPIRDMDGNLLNYRMYNPKKAPKWLGLDGIKAEGLLPHKVDPSLGPVLIVEGEGDCLCGRANGLNTYSGTAGSTTWKDDWTTRFTSCESVGVMYDNDQAGITGSILVGEAFVQKAIAVKVIKSLSKLPKGDLCDLFAKEGCTTNQVLAAIEAAPWFENENSLLESFTEVDFTDLLSLKPNARVKTRFKVFQIDGQAGLLSSRVLIDCKRNTKKVCKDCPAVEQDQFILPCDPTGIDRMQTHQVTTNAAALKQLLRLNCADIMGQFDNKYTLHKCTINHPDSPFTSAKPIEECIMVSDDSLDVVNPIVFDAQVEVGNYPKAGAGNGQKVKTWYIFKPTKTQSSVESFSPTKEFDLLAQFRAKPGGEATKIADIYEDLESKIAIQDRLHPIIAADLCFLSAKEIVIQAGMFQEKVKGVLEVAVFGSTRTGKTKIAERLSHFYMSGRLYDCANLSHAALVGMAGGGKTGGRFTPGILPKSDGDLIILDEADKYPDEQKFLKLTATRSSGIARYNKLDQAQALPARVRIIWIANPPGQRDMGSYSFPFEVFRDVMKQDAAVARFDFAISVISKEFIKLAVKDKKKYEHQAYQKLLLFSRGLKSNEIEISDGAIEYINNSISMLFERFGRDKGPVSNDIEEKLMRISTAVAIRLFNYNLDQKKLLVTEQHAMIAVDYMVQFHSHKDVAYDAMHALEQELSTSMRDENTFYNAFEIINDDDERTLLAQSIEENIGVAAFDRDQLVNIFPKSGAMHSGMEFFEKMINSGAVYSHTARDERGNTKPKYKFSRDGLLYVSAVREIGLESRSKVSNKVKQLKTGDEPEQQELGVPF